MPVDSCCGRLWTVMVLVMQTDAPFWDSLVFGGIDEVDVEAVTAALGTVEVVADPLQGPVRRPQRIEDLLAQHVGEVLLRLRHRRRQRLPRPPPLTARQPRAGRLLLFLAICRLRHGTPPSPQVRPEFFPFFPA
ncbi:hypothetical protein ACFWWC_49860 [Streptomyces sp. NPDC058642]|uniref:hypothetical protein n=1 Tax=Streptomyces sp. NPDC058642 TaxID=3346572 RepID=UPI003648709F